MSGFDARLSRLVVAAAVLDRLETPTALLCAARSYPPEYAGQFELPGGKVELEERPRPALVRELDEEIGLRVRLGPELVPPSDLADPAPLGGPPGDDAPAWPVMRGFRMRVWLAEPALAGDRGRVGTDHQRLEWVSLDPSDRLRRLPWLSADLPIIDELMATLGR